MPGEALRILGGETPRFQNNQHIKVVRLSAIRTGHLYPQEVFLVLISVRGRVNPRVIELPEGLSQLRIPVAQSRIEPATFQLVGYCLNQLRHRVPPLKNRKYIKVLFKIQGKTFKFNDNIYQLRELFYQ
jgi:hypothetical protein